MSSLMKRNQQIERTKRYLFLGVGGLGLASLLFKSTFLGVILLGVGGYLGWKWLQFRIKNSIRF